MAPSRSTWTRCRCSAGWPRIAPKPPEAPAATAEPDRTRPAGGYRPWAEILARTFAVDVLICPSCQGRMRLLAMIKEPASIARYLAAGEATEVPRRSPGRGPPACQGSIGRGERRARPPARPRGCGLTREPPSYYLRSGQLREGVSREIAAAVFAAVKG